MKILILCTGNSCRSQMAHGFLQSFDNKLDVFSAGTKPAEKVNPMAVKVMDEMGIDLTHHTPKSVNLYIGQEWDYVITVCGGANESCPMFTGEVRNRLHIGFDDPSEATGTPEFINSEFHRVRDEIKARFYDFYLKELRPQLSYIVVVMEKKQGIGFFEKYLTIWVALCIIIGIAVGQWLPAIPQTLSKFEYANVSIPVAILIWLMIYPMMLKVDFQSVKNVGKRPKGIIVTCVTNWLIKPFTMFGIAYLFFYVVFKAFIPAGLAEEYLAGAVLLGAAPCTAMVFVWSYLTKGDAAYTLVQVAVNDLIILVAFAPIVAFLLGVGGVSIPWDTLLLSVGLFVVIPLAAGVITRIMVIRRKGVEYFNNVFIKKFNNYTVGGLLLTLIILFSFQGETILNNPLHILLIAVPLVLQTVLIFFVAYGWAKWWKLPHDVAAPAGMIGASNFFELAVAVAISLFGLQSGAALATVVGVLVEVPVMLMLVRIANNTRSWFPATK